MRIDDYELMGYARRTYLAELQRRQGAGGLSQDEARCQSVLAEDQRLEGALFMDWQLNDEFDQALTAALAFIDGRVEEELAAKGIPEHELPEYIAGRREAIRRTIAILEGEGPQQ